MSKSQQWFESQALRLEKNQTFHEQWVADVLLRWCKKKDLLCHPQIAIHGYILDFFFPQLNLAIELDGNQHNSTRDAQRDTNLLKKGIQVIQFKNPTNQTELSNIFWRVYAEARYKLKRRWKPGNHKISTNPQAS